MFDEAFRELKKTVRVPFKDEEIKYPLILRPNMFEYIRLENHVTARGTYSVVVKADFNGNELACKIIPRKLYEKRSEDYYDNFIGGVPVDIYFFEETTIHNKLHHKNILPPIRITEDSNNFYILTKFIAGGSVGEYIKAGVFPYKITLSEAFIKVIFTQMLEVVQYLHEINICHCDLKPENFLMDDEYNIYLIDFGCSVEVGDDCLIGHSRGTPLYCSPECFTCQPYDGKASDIWSLGVILYKLCTGTIPWGECQTGKELREKMSSGEIPIPNFVNPFLAAIINGFLDTNPVIRMTIKEALNVLKFIK